MKDESDPSSAVFIPHPSYFILNITGCGVTLASESWELAVTVQFCPPRPTIANFQLSISNWSLDDEPIGNRKSTIGNASAPVAQMEERDASNVEAAGSSPARSSITD